MRLEGVVALPACGRSLQLRVGSRGGITAGRPRAARSRAAEGRGGQPCRNTTRRSNALLDPPPTPLPPPCISATLFSVWQCVEASPSLKPCHIRVVRKESNLCERSGERRESERGDNCGSVDANRRGARPCLRRARSPPTAQPCAENSRQSPFCNTCKRSDVAQRLPRSRPGVGLSEAPMPPHMAAATSQAGARIGAGLPRRAGRGLLRICRLHSASACGCGGNAFPEIVSHRRWHVPLAGR